MFKLFNQNNNNNYTKNSAIPSTGLSNWWACERLGFEKKKGALKEEEPTSFFLFHLSKDKKKEKKRKYPFKQTFKHFKNDLLT